MPLKSNAQLLAEYRALVNELPTQLPNGVFVIGGTTYTTPQLVALVNQMIETVTNVPLKLGELQMARAALDKARTTTGVTIEAARQMIALQVTKVTTLAALGIVPRKKASPLSVEAKLAKAAKAKATRIARGTKSKKQLAKITGDVVGVTITPTVRAAEEPEAPEGGGQP
jgi:hypothetical protein